MKINWIIKVTTGKSNTILSSILNKGQDREDNINDGFLADYKHPKEFHPLVATYVLHRENGRWYMYLFYDIN